MHFNVHKNTMPHALLDSAALTKMSKLFLNVETRFLSNYFIYL